MNLCYVTDQLTRCVIAGSALILATCSLGCHGSSLFKRDKTVPHGTAETFKGAADMAAAEELYLQEQWSKAESLFEKVADDTSNPPLHAEKARFFEAECLRLQGDYVDAMSTFNRLLIDFQYGVYREQAVGRMYEIANYWLDDTRTQLEAEQEVADGKRWFVPFNYIHFEKSKPTFDQEGHALKMLETVYFNDPTGPYADKALFAAGYVQFRRGNFREADQLLSQLIENSDRGGRKSEYRDRAYELAILAKNNSAGGPHYDGRKASESLKLINQARMTSPELATQRGDFLDNQMKMVRYMQAEKDYDIAEFYRRTGHPASAWFYYELVRRRYSGSEFSEKAVARMKEINTDLAEQKQQPEIAKATRREFNKWILGMDVPTLAANEPVPAIPGEAPPVVGPANPVTPVSGQQSPSSEGGPRR